MHPRQHRQQRPSAHACVVLPATNDTLVRARCPHAGQSAGAGLRWRLLSGTAFWYCVPGICCGGMPGAGASWAYMGGWGCPWGALGYCCMGTEWLSVREQVRMAAAVSHGAVACLQLVQPLDTNGHNVSRHSARQSNTRCTYRWAFP